MQLSGYHAGKPRDAEKETALHPCRVTRGVVGVFPVYVCFMDLEKAYDHVPLWSLVGTDLAPHTPAELLNKSLYNQSESSTHGALCVVRVCDFHE